MLGRKREDNSWEQAVGKIYAQLMVQARKPVFYSTYGVPDTFEGRFDSLLLHVFMVMHVQLMQEGGEAFNQALFDVMFADMDQALREAGKGDMGVSKQMKRMMKAFNGRMNRYHEAFGDAPAFEAALRLNLLVNLPVDDVSDSIVTKMRLYVECNIEALAEQVDEMIEQGEVKMIAIEEMQ